MSAAAQVSPPSLDDVVAIAGAAAAEVDRDGRFPREALDAMRAAGLLGAHVPVALGGDGLNMAGMTRIAFRLGQVCASSAMIYAMHQIQVTCLVNHGADTPPLRAHLARVAPNGLLLASVTSESGARGDIRTSGTGNALGPRPGRAAGLRGECGVGGRPVHLWPPRP